MLLWQHNGNSWPNAWTRCGRVTVGHSAPCSPGVDRPCSLFFIHIRCHRFSPAADSEDILFFSSLFARVHSVFSMAADQRAIICATLLHRIAQCHCISSFSVIELFLGGIVGAAQADLPVFSPSSRGMPGRNLLFLSYQFLLPPILELLWIAEK